ncbi:MAG: winged helix-turn-helix transcriptional regulator [Clostridium sp.]|nr:winged helix-turn-helix transcriptional regulator [Clostridium sp.]
MKANTSVQLAELKGLTTYHYKVILYLFGKKEATQSEMSKNFEVSKQNINKVCKELCSMDIISIKRKEGRNTFWSLNPNPRFQAKGQLRLEDFNS